MVGTDKRHGLPIGLSLSLFFCAIAAAHQTQVDDAAEKLGEVSFPISCQAVTQKEFNRGVALLHSFAYARAEARFRKVAEQDPQCAMAHWGIAMTHFHQLWQPPIAPTAYLPAQKEIKQSLRLGAATDKERAFIHATEVLFRNAATVPYSTRAQRYEQAMSAVAAENRKDTEAQVFYALAMLANAPASDSTHSRQKKAADLLEPLFRSFPEHPGIAHYLIHAYDNRELAARGLPAARLYSKIAPSEPHALHMPSHIFTRLGLWEDSITSNIAARSAAHRAGDFGEELHAMDYLVYAYLQLGRDAEAAEVIQQVKAIPALNSEDFKVAYASTAMPIRYLIERSRWAEAAAVPLPNKAPLEVTAIAVWAQGLGLARTGDAKQVDRRAKDLRRIEDQLRASRNGYGATQVKIMADEVAAWKLRAERKDDEAAALMRQAADDEDSLEKLPVTPGPIVPAREQLGSLLLEQGQPGLAAKEFQTALAAAPERLGALRGLSEAAIRAPQR